MIHGEKQTVEPAKKVGNVGADDLATNEQRPLLTFAGEEVTTPLWIGQIYDQNTVDAPVERPGKK